jgi:hypothetical protein
MYVHGNSIMRTTLLILATTLTFALAPAHAQDKTTLISAIRKEFNAINHDTTLKKVVLENEEFLPDMTDGGGQLSGFYQAGQIRKIVSWVGRSNGNEVCEFYFQDGTLIFVYAQFNSFVYDEKAQTLRLDATEKTFEGRYYFHNGKLIEQVIAGRDRFEAEDVEKMLLTRAGDDRKLLEQKMKGKRM